MFNRGDRIEAIGRERYSGLLRAGDTGTVCSGPTGENKLYDVKIDRRPDLAFFRLSDDEMRPLPIIPRPTIDADRSLKSGYDFKIGLEEYFKGLVNRAGDISQFEITPPDVFLPPNPLVIRIWFRRTT